MPKINFSAKIPYTVFREGRAFIAYSPMLDLSTSGATFEEVTRRFDEVVEIFVEDLVEKSAPNLYSG